MSTESASPNSPHSLQAITDVIDRLLAPEGCPWDREQTPESLADYVIEECFELVEAIRSGKVHDVREELGDVMFLLAFIGRLYADKGAFTLADAVEGNAAKMIRRHPHVFAEGECASREELLRNWERIKREEKAAAMAEDADAEGDAQAAPADGASGDAPGGVFDSLPKGLPPLVKAYRLHSKAARVDFTWESDEDVEQQVEAEWLEWLDASASGDKERQEQELGDFLFTIVELGRRKGIKANAALDYATLKFLRRFEGMEALARERGLDFPNLPFEEKDALWNEVKAAEKA
ncbi:nucleoside triphosphate pyrophosphohydrolase [Desulfovibrio oxamicus]|uniref:Nucleoside triphosphate pyrophosphohydrolase n=1 Tax=Nitratidesulfovibrio oxamicus TaxID=32016 RepID=A0ABS0J0G4_9BACT|nr:nucleoside triphosphate pyrophosphohydrolase [Nitratidesulfovibrio oxamicus]MBG3875903.1 nucleoside triphosphate pyrophosphohydrolase [Nitratidesulfovibrio oxamicus]